MIPTNEDLNRAMAEALGWYALPCGGGFMGCLLYKNGVPKSTIARPSEDHCFAEDGHDYCTDRNALPEVWNHLYLNKREAHFVSEIRDLLVGKDGGQAMRFDLITCEPRLQVIAALCALNKWPADWSV